MKTIKIILSFMIIVFSISKSFSQEYLPPFFNPNDIRAIPVCNPNPNYVIGKMRFDLSEIILSNNRLDLATTSNLHYYNVDTRVGQWNPNNGNGYFGTCSEFYWGDASTGEMKDILFVKLRDGNYPKDIVVVKSDRLQVHLNTNNAISSSYQSYSNNGSSSADAGGAFDYSDTREDIAVITGNQINIFKNNRDGTLNETPWTFSYSADKMKLRQMTDKNRPEIQSSENDKADLIIYKKELNPVRTRIIVYKNNGQNGFESTPFSDFYVNYLVSDIEVADINGDEYNDVILVGTNAQGSIGQSFLNAQGYSLTSYPDWNVTGLGLGSSPLVTTADVNKDGINDIITVTTDGYTNIFLSPNINTSNQTFTASGPYFSVECIKAVDVHNTGAISLLLSYAGDYGNFYYYGISLVPPDPSRVDPAPPPPTVYKDYYQYGGLYRPKLSLYNKDERDFNHYQIWKAGRGASEYTLYADNVTDNYFIDYNEYIIFSDDDRSTVNNCFYFAKSVDGTNHISGGSSPTGYRVGEPYCSECAEDNPMKLQKKNMKLDNFLVTNFPNPFNPVAKIIYTLPKEANVTIIVYDILGKEITKLVNNQNKKAGMHLVEFDGSNLSSGIYFYRIQAGNFIQIKKMILLK